MRALREQLIREWFKYEAVVEELFMGYYQEEVEEYSQVVSLQVQVWAQGNEELEDPEAMTCKGKWCIWWMCNWICM